jgi:ubiquitin C-terminal hydrolase
MSAALQALSNCYAFSSYFLECPLNVTHLSNSKIIQKNSDSSNMSIANNYMKLMKDLWQGKMYNINKSGAVVGTFQSITPSEMVHAIKLNNPMFRGYMQHDSQELLIYLMDQLHEELKRPINISTKRKAIKNKNKRDEEEEEEEEIERDESGVNHESIENDMSMSPHYENGDEEDDDDITVCFFNNIMHT